MSSEELVLNIAVNMERLCRWSSEGNNKRVEQFITQTESYISMLENQPKRKAFLKTFENFKRKFFELKKKQKFDYVWSDDALTWANILTHRAKLV